MTLAIRLFIILAAMIAFLTSMVIRHAEHRANGFEIILAMEPLDPRDLMLGYYSIIRTEAHRLDMAGLDGPKTGWRAGERAFVTLEEDETGDWRPVGAFKARPESGVFLQGRVRFVSARSDMRETPGQDDAELGEGRRERDAISGAERDVLSMVYNLEAYYAEADQARALDMMRNEDRLRLIVALAPDGSAVIKGLEIDGERRIDRVIGAPR